MEANYYQMLLLFTYALTLLSFIIPNNITLRMFSGLFLVTIALVGFRPTMYVGFGSVNAISYFGTQAGDPGRAEEIYVLLLYGLLGAVQLILSFFTMLKWGDNVLQSHGRSEGQIKVQ